MTPSLMLGSLSILSTFQDRGMTSNGIVASPLSLSCWVGKGPGSRQGPVCLGNDIWILEESSNSTVTPGTQPGEAQNGTAEASFQGCQLLGLFLPTWAHPGGSGGCGEGIEPLSSAFIEWISLCSGHQTSSPKGREVITKSNSFTFFLDRIWN